MGRPSDSSSSTIDSSSHPNYSVCSSSSVSSSKRDLSTDLRLGLSISSSSSRDHEQPDWPPIKRTLRNTLAMKGSNDNSTRPTFYVKVYLEGIPIGRKLDLLAHHGYVNLISTLSHMFLTTIIYPGVDRVHSDHEDYHVLTYEDKEGDWMMVGDVPWNMFLTTVKRLKILHLSVYSFVLLNGTCCQQQDRKQVDMPCSIWSYGLHQIEMYKIHNKDL